MCTGWPCYPWAYSLSCGISSDTTSDVDGHCRDMPSALHHVCVSMLVQPLLVSSAACRLVMAPHAEPVQPPWLPAMPLQNAAEQMESEICFQCSGPSADAPRAAASVGPRTDGHASQLFQWLTTLSRSTAPALSPAQSHHTGGALPPSRSQPPLVHITATKSLDVVYANPKVTKCSHALQAREAL